MNLVLDLGNTTCKAAIFKDETIADHKVLPGLSAENLEAIFSSHPEIKNVIISSVIDYDTAIVKPLKKRYHVIQLNEQTPIPIQNLYQTPETLGNDRLANAIAANRLFPEQNSLVIDAGTCIKFDFVNKNGEYQGGTISPGIVMRFKALHTFTDRLPLVNFDNYQGLFGKTTEEAIMLGVMNGIMAEVKGVISGFEKQFPGLNIVLTGGDMHFFDKELKSSIFADHFFTLKGLNVILDFNVTAI